MLFLTDEDDFEMLRQKRRAQLQKQIQQEQTWKHFGHGVYEIYRLSNYFLIPLL
jgi:hypothetical protein